MKAVRFQGYGGPEVLEVVDVPEPSPGRGEVVVRVVAAGTNPGESAIRSGAMKEVSRRTSRKARAATWRVLSPASAMGSRTWRSAMR
jgi:NADPH:quinone reductase-like Zn-dependent oxidoreductase